MQVFRSAYKAKDARRAAPTAGDAEVTQRSQLRRAGVGEATLRQHLEADLGSLLNTINLASAEPLDDVPEVARSILNYGFDDMSSVTPHSFGRNQVTNSVRQSLLNHEPRFIPGTLDVQLRDRGTKDQRLGIQIKGELVGDPVEVPIDFDADIDFGSGNMKLGKLKVKQ